MFMIVMVCTVCTFAVSLGYVCAFAIVDLIPANFYLTIVSCVGDK